MSSRDLIVNALNGRKQTQVPVMLHNFLMAAHEQGVSMKQYRSSSKTITDVHISAAEEYGCDAILIDIDTCTLAGACGVPVDLPEDEPARVTGAAIAEIEDASAFGIPDISKNDRVKIWVDACRAAVEKARTLGLFVRGNCDQAPFSLASMLRGTENWMMDVFDPGKEKYVHELLEICTQVCSQFMTMIAKTGVDMVSNGDSVSGPDLVSPDIYRRYALPYEKRIVEHAHSLNKPYLLHICGCVDKILDDMISTGANCLELDYKTNLDLIYSKCKDKVTFCGNIDPSGVLALGTVEEVRAKTNELLSKFRDNPRFILNAGCAIPGTTPSENLKAMIETAKSFGR